MPLKAGRTLEHSTYAGLVVRASSFSQHMPTVIITKSNFAVFQRVTQLPIWL